MFDLGVEGSCCFQGVSSPCLEETDHKSVLEYALG